MTDIAERSRSRVEYLLEGRRVLVADLLEANLIEAGAQLSLSLVRRGTRYEATVRMDGWLILSDGRSFRSPSKAAAVAAGVRALDGWHSWVVMASGRSLDSYRQELLDAAVDDADETADHSVADVRRARQRHDRLKEARGRSDAGDPIELSVRELLDWWGANRRGSQISQQIESELSNYGLVTLPNFLKVTPDAKIEIVTIPESSDQIEKPNQDPERPEDVPSSGLTSVMLNATVDSDAPDTPLFGPTVGNLPSANGPLISITPQTTFDAAITIMLLNDFSQLPVLSGPRQVLGAVSWRSIAQARNINPQATLRDAVVPVPVVSFDADLVELLPQLLSSDFVLVLQ